MKIIDNYCPVCRNLLLIKELYCEECDLSLKGEFGQSIFHGLSPDDQQFVFDFVVNSGSLKQMAGSLNKSYPTVRNRLDNIIEILKASRKKERKLGTKKDVITNLVEQGQLSIEAANKIIELLKS